MFTIAKVEHPIIGADFLQHFDLLVDIRRRKICDRETFLEVSVISSKIDKEVTAIKTTTVNHDVLADSKDLLTSSHKLGSPSHNVKHHIDTQGPPICERARRLAPDKLKIAKAEFEFMCEQGICRPRLAIINFKHALEGRKFILYTDHKPLVHAFTQKSDKASPRQLRHLDLIGQFTTDIRHISGVDKHIDKRYTFEFLPHLNTLAADILLDAK